jgi:hypothetical protein
MKTHIFEPFALMGMIIFLVIGTIIMCGNRIDNIDEPETSNIIK